MEKNVVKGESDKRKNCPLCKVDLELITMGSKKFPIWVHRGEQLKKCQAIKISTDLMRLLMIIFKKLGKQKMSVPLKEDGTPQVFGEQIK